MRDFFKNELKTLKARTGLNQYENLSAMEDAPNQFKVLFDSLEFVCKLPEFANIPDESKKAIIQESILKDQEFNNLNSRIVWKWLNAKKDLYFAKQDEPEETAAEILTGERKQARIKEVLEEIAKFPPPVKLHKSFEEVRTIKATSQTVGYKPDPTAAQKHAKHIAWIQVNYNPMTQKEKTIDEGWISEEDFNASN